MRTYPRVSAAALVTTMVVVDVPSHTWSVALGRRVGKVVRQLSLPAKYPLFRQSTPRTKPIGKIKGETYEGQHDTVSVV